MFSTLLATSTLAFAALSSAQFLNQTGPFKLTIFSQHNETLNGSSLYACHEGAAIEGLCNAGTVNTIKTSSETYNFNYTDSIQPQNGLAQEGYLTFLLQGANFNESEPMEFAYNPSSNVAHAIFSPSETGQLIAFDKDNLMNIQSYIDDTVYPPKAGAGKAYYRWYMCTTYFGSYTYETLNWALGAFPPQNPSCQKVDVKKENV